MAAEDTLTDWAGIRAAAVTVGVREAARQASAHLPPHEQKRFADRVMKRSSREKWMPQADSAKIIATQRNTSLSAPVSTGAKAAENSLESLSKRGRLAFLRAGVAAGEHLASLSDPDELLAQAQDAKAWASVTAQAGGWSTQDSGSAAPVHLSIHLRGIEIDEPREVQGRVIESE